MLTPTEVGGLVKFLASYSKQHQSTIRAVKEYKSTNSVHAALQRTEKYARTVSEIYRDACSSGSQERVVRFKIFKKGGSSASGCHGGG